MTIATAHSLLELSDSRAPRAGGMLALSLALHCALFAMIATVRLAPKVERPLASYQVSLVSLPTPVRATPAPLPVPKPAEPAPPPQVEEPLSPSPVPTAEAPPAPAVPPPMPQFSTAPTPQRPVPPPPAPAKATAPRASPVTAAPPPREAANTKSETADPLRDAFKGIELPPDAPRLGELPPPAPGVPPRRVEAYRTTPAAPKLSNRIRDLKVPEVRPAPMPSKAIPLPPAQEQPRPIVSPDLLEKLQQPVEQISRPPEPRPIERKDFRLTTAQPAIPSQDAAAKLQGVAPITAIQTSAAQGNPYWTLIRHRINSKWVAPPVDLTQRSLQVVIRFKLDRAGKVSDIMVEQSSGNDYYDNAGKRAVLAADPLPPFPPDITERQITTHFIFTVGEQAG